VVFSGVSIDPGSHTAFAIWDKGRLDVVFTFDLGNGVCDSMRIKTLRCLLKSSPLKSDMFAVVEDQSVWFASPRSMASAARGDIMTPAKIAGALGFYFTYVMYVQPIVWKGNLDNTALRYILKNKFGYTEKDDHEANAIGIGLWKMGRFK
jgi:hypothetical protein